MARDSVRQGGILGLWGACCPASTACRAHGVAPTLAIVRVGERPDDLSYERTCARQADLRHRRASFRAANGGDAGRLEGRHRPLNADARIRLPCSVRFLPRMDERAVVCPRPKASGRRRWPACSPIPARFPPAAGLPGDAGFHDIPVAGEWWCSGGAAS